MADIIVSGNSSGSVTLRAPDVSGTTILTLPTTSGTLVTTAGGSTVPFALGSAAAPSITFTGDTNTGMFSPGADIVAFSEGGVESMRITSAGVLLVGTTSPLGVSGELVTLSNSANTVLSVVSTNDTTPSVQFRSNSVDRLTIDSSSTFGAYFNVRSNQDIRFGTNNTERMRIASDGNVGINNTSPAVIASTVQVAIKANVNGNSLFVAQNSNGLTTAKFGFQFTGGIDQPIVGTETAHPLVFVTNNTDRLRIPADASGIQFPATQVASSNANTLDDYEEGTWTPSVGGNATYSQRSGRYIKIGNTVSIYGQMLISALGTGSTQVISGLPFSSTFECCIPVDKSQNLSTSITWMALRVSGTDLYAVTRTGASTSGNVNAAFMTTSTEIQFAGTYII